MAPIKCSYYGCLNTTMHHSLFRFPTKHLDRLRIWLENAGNVALSSLTHEELRNRYICDAHFDANSIKSQGKRTRLKRDALPQPCSVNQSEKDELRHSPELKVNLPTKVYTKITNDNVKKSSIYSFPFDFDFPSPPTSEEIEKLKNIISVSNKIIKAKNMELTKLKYNIQNKNLFDFEKFPFKSNASKVITKMQLKKQTIKKWAQDENNFCLSLYSRSPGVYKFLRKTGIILASQSAVLRWQRQVMCQSGGASTSAKPIVRATYSSSDDDDDSVADDPPDQQSDTGGGDELSMYLKMPKKSSKPTGDSPGQHTDKDEDQRHEGFSCSSCSSNIVGYRYTCVQCLNYDMCASCEAKGAHCLHYVLRIPKPAPYAEVQSMLTAIRSHLLYGADPEPVVEVPVEEEPLETIKVEIKEEAPDPLESDQALVTDENYAAYSHETKKEFTVPEETISVSQIPYKTATSTGMIDNTLVIIENPVLSEPESKRRRANSPPPLVPTSSRVAPTSAHLAPGSGYIAQTLTHKASGSKHLAPTSANLAPGPAHLAPGSARMAPAPDPAQGRMLENIILYPQRKEPAAVEDKDESSSFQVFSHVKKKPSKSQATPGQRGGTAPASTSRSDDKK